MIITIIGEEIFLLNLIHVETTRGLEEKNSVRTFIIVCALSIVASTKRNTSSANNACEMKGPFLLIAMAVQFDRLIC